MLSQKRSFCLLVIVLTFLLTGSSNMNDIERQNSRRIQSDLYQSPTPIVIDGNNDFHQQAITEDWYMGGTRDGSAEYPYVISGLNITLDTSSLIFINNTNVYFHLIGNFLNGKNISKTGIFLGNVTNAVIHNNTIQSINSSGIHLFNSTANNITQNEIFNNTYNGILVEYSNKNRISENNISFSNFAEKYRYTAQPYSGITLTHSAENSLLKNDLFKNRNGIYLHSSDNNHITNNTVYQNDEGIWIEVFSNNNLIQGNSIFENRINHGIGLLSSDNNTIIENTVFNNGNFGIDTNALDNITISNNRVFNNRHGIMIWNTDNALVKSNYISNINYCGIRISGQSSDWIALNNSVILNNISKCNIGVQVGEFVSQMIFPACSTRVLNNTIYKNQEYGIKLTCAANYTDVHWNSLYLNAPFKSSQAYDNGTNNVLSNNTWHDWLSPDVNNDGIFDDYYPVDGEANNFDLYPLVPKVTYPDPPHSITITTDGEIVNLEWSYPLSDGGSSIVAYHIYRSQTSGMYYVLLGQSTQLSFVDADVLAGHIYYYVIISVNSFGEGVFSGEVNISIPYPTTSSTSSDTTTSGTSSSTTTPGTSSDTTTSDTSSSTSTTSSGTSTNPSITSAINPITLLLSFIVIMIISRKRLRSK